MQILRVQILRVLSLVLYDSLSDPNRIEVRPLVITELPWYPSRTLFKQIQDKRTLMTLKTLEVPQVFMNVKIILNVMTELMMNTLNPQFNKLNGESNCPLLEKVSCLVFSSSLRKLGSESLAW